MNDFGQLLIYDILIGTVLLIIIIAFSIYVFEQETKVYDDISDFEKPLDILNLLSDTPYEGSYLLEELSHEIDNNTVNNKTITEIEDIISSNNKYEYTFTDTTNGKLVLIDTRKNHYKTVFSSKKIVDKHEYELKYYSN